jgi:hypothetical protein
MSKIKTACVFCAFLGLNSERLIAMPAGVDDVKNYIKKGHVALQLGAYSAGSQGREQHIDINTIAGDQFTLSQNAKSNGLVGVGYFLDGQSKDRFSMSYGLNGFYLAKTRVSGGVLKENLYENLTYAYNITNYPLYVVAKSTWNSPAPNHHITLDVGIGPNFMLTNNFSEQGVYGGAVTFLPDQVFSSNVTTTFSATAGVGLKFDHFFGAAPLECGYRFFYLGQGHFNVINDQLQNTLKTGNSYANALLCSVIV